jgi:hypothetical protein
MPRNDALQKHTLNLRTGDWDYLDSVFGPQGISTSTVIRRLVAQTVDHLRAHESPADINLGVNFDD